MPKTILRAVVLSALLGPSLAAAQVSMGIRIDLPVVLPQLVVVSPGVQVVPDVDEEVFFTDGYYWARRDGRWYRSRSHREGWVLVGPALVPARIANVPPGQYRRWHPGAAAERAHERKERREEAKEMRKEAREREKEHRKHGKHGGDED